MGGACSPAYHTSKGFVLMWSTDKQIGLIHVLCRKLGRTPACDPRRLSKADASTMITQLLSEQETVRRCCMIGVSRRADRLSRFLRRA